MRVTDQEVLLDDDLIEKDFNEALNDLHKSLKSEKSLRKAKDAYEDEEESEDEEEPEEEDEEEEVEKSLSDIVSEDPEAAAAMEVSEFLNQLVKALDESISQVARRVSGVEKLVKSQAKMVEASAVLQKSTRDILKQIGGQPVATSSIRRMEKSRFETTDGKLDFDNMAVLAKSRDWVKTRKIDITEAGMIEGRINKGRLGRVNDRLDQKVAALMREDG